GAVARAEGRTGEAKRRRRRRSRRLLSSRRARPGFAAAPLMARQHGPQGPSAGEHDQDEDDDRKRPIAGGRARTARLAPLVLSAAGSLGSRKLLELGTPHEVLIQAEVVGDLTVSVRHGILEKMGRRAGGCTGAGVSYRLALPTSSLASTPTRREVRNVPGNWRSTGA